MKPAFEPVLVFRKPITEKTVAKQVLKTGTGAINIDGCRVGTTTRTNASGPGKERTTMVKGMVGGTETEVHNYGRWPSNIVFSHALGCRRVGTAKVDAPAINRFTDGAKPFGNGAGHPYESQQTGDAEGKEEIAVYECQDGCPVKTLDDQSGVLKTSGGPLNRSGIGFQGGSDGNQDYVPPSEGGASRFFPQFECVEGCPVKELGEQSGELESHGGGRSRAMGFSGGDPNLQRSIPKGDAGTAARFFPQFEQLEAPFMYATKVSKRERNAGLGQPCFELRDDLTAEQREYVMRELAAAGVSL